MPPAPVPVPKVQLEGLYTLGTVTDINGQPRSLAEFAGQVSLIVNVASQCGYTKTNYESLQALYDKFRARGFTVLAFPCNQASTHASSSPCAGRATQKKKNLPFHPCLAQFGSQEPAEDREILRFAKDTYGATFPMFSKVEVNGTLGRVLCAHRSGAAQRRPPAPAHRP